MLQDSKVAKSGDTMTGLLRATAGINFNASSGDTLDNYSKGAWTPNVTSNNGSASTYDEISGSWTRVGNLITFTGEIRATNGTLGDSGFALRITGLPWTVIVMGTGVGINRSNLTEGATLVAYSTTIDFYFTAAIPQNQRFTFSGQYYI